MTPMKKNATILKRSGHVIDETMERIGLLESSLRLRVAQLEKAGCRNGSLHFKSDRPNIMFLLEPTDGTGKRRYVHIGTDPEKQQEATAQLARFTARESIRRKLFRIALEKDRLTMELLSLEADFKELETEAIDAARGYADPAIAGDRCNPSEGSRLAGSGSGSR